MKIFVGNISASTTAGELKTLFQRHGAVKACHVVKHHGFVHMEDGEEARRAIEALHQSELQGRQLNVAQSGDEGGPAAAAKVYVDNVALGSTSQELQARFEVLGRLTECTIIKDYAFVHMEHEEEALKAIDKMDFTGFKRRKIRVQLSKKSTKPQSAGGPVDNCQHCGRPGHQAAECFWAPYGSLDSSRWTPLFVADSIVHSNPTSDRSRTWRARWPGR
ncbi:RNA-binding protein 4.1-like isoform X2 [Heptranchias perlo]|uniref:RNA-binding protein 4.1-like isoform X2 n=1 Tax=Heptranchias perlo TaxID=212740 RepID=UPI0035596CFF